MDIAIRQIDRRPIGLALGLQGVPLCGTEYFCKLTFPTCAVSRENRQPSFLPMGFSGGWN